MRGSCLFLFSCLLWLNHNAGAVKTCVVVGGGAAGFFGGIQTRACPLPVASVQTIILEQGSKPLQKVKISGGGRCNVLHDDTKAIPEISQGYARGKKELLGSLTRFGPPSTAAWFRERGVALKTEPDGRMFPTTDQSQTVIDCLTAAADEAGVAVMCNAKVTSIHRLDSDGCDDSSSGGMGSGSSTGSSSEDGGGGKGRFKVHFSSDAVVPAGFPIHKVGGSATAASGIVVSGGTKQKYSIQCDYVLLACGSSKEGYRWAEQLGHQVYSPVPSLFTLTVRDTVIEGLAGIALAVEVTLIPAQPKIEVEVDSSGTDESDMDADAAMKKKKRKRKGKGGGKATDPLLTQKGPLLITHTGVSGPAALKLSAFGARKLYEAGYKGTLRVNWLGGGNVPGAATTQAVLKRIQELRTSPTMNSRLVHTYCPPELQPQYRAALEDNGIDNNSNYVYGEDIDTYFSSMSDQATRPPPPPPPPPPSPSASSAPTIPKRLWQALLTAAGIGERGTTVLRWAEVSNAMASALSVQLTACDLQIVGKGAFKEEFVTCGGVSLKEINMKTMESKLVPGLYFAGEVCDIDGITGGYNLQSAWTTGYIAGTSIASAAADVADEVTPVTADAALGAALGGS